MTSHMTNESSRAKALRDAAANVVDRDGCEIFVEHNEVSCCDRDSGIARERWCAICLLGAAIDAFDQGPTQ